jgi:hypothetical protein
MPPLYPENAFQPPGPNGGVPGPATLTSRL